MDEQTPPGALRPPRLERWPGADGHQAADDGGPGDERPEAGPFEAVAGILLWGTVLAGGVLTLVPAHAVAAPVRTGGLVLVALGLAAGTVAVLVRARRAGLSWPAVLWRTVVAPFRLALWLLP